MFIAMTRGESGKILGLYGTLEEAQERCYAIAQKHLSDTFVETDIPPTPFEIEAYVEYGFSIFEPTMGEDVEFRPFKFRDEPNGVWKQHSPIKTKKGNMERQ
jgi:hypothetical protein